MIIVLVGTGTAGHSYAAQALAEHLIQEDHEVHFMTSETGFENHLLAELSLPLHRLSSRPFFGVSGVGRVLAAFSLVRCFWQARKKLNRIRPDQILGFGGHVSAACILAAKSLGITTAIHEANSLAGFGNRLVKNHVDRIYLGSLACHTVFNEQKTLCTGLPVRSVVQKNICSPQSPNKKSLNLLILGGSNGATFLNRNIPSLIKQLASKGISVAVTHQAGENDLTLTHAAYETEKIQANVVGYSLTIHELYEQADIVISSAGAGTLAELCLWGVPCFLIPLAVASENHQEANAREFARLTETGWCREADWNIETVIENMLTLMSEPQAYEHQSQAMLDVGSAEAAQIISEDLLKN